MPHHLDRLSSIDASFLHQERGAAHMHIGGVLRFAGPPPPFEEYVRHVGSRLHLVPRYRQKLVVPPLQTGRPMWADDPAFDLSYHVRRAALPAPGGTAELLALVARIAGERLDRARPLWENWLIEDAEDGGFAVVIKTHHALVDGISGVDLATVLFDVEPQPPPSAPGAELELWRPAPDLSPIALMREGVRGTLRAAVGMGARAAGAVTRPATAARLVRDATEGVGEIVWAGLHPAPSSPLNVSITALRRCAVVDQRLADYKEVKDALGGTVNDVVLTVVAGALGRWLQGRGVPVRGTELQALVPVSVRSDAQRGSLGNRLTLMRAPLPVAIADPATRLRYVRHAMDGLKGSKQAVGAATLAAVTDLAPPTVLAQASRLNFSTRLFNLIVTNIPGPQIPLYLLGRRLREVYPLAFLPTGHALAVAVMSYDGRLGYGLLGDHDALADLDVVASGIDTELAMLLSAARGRDGTTPVSIVPGAGRAGGRARSGPGTEMRARRSTTRARERRATAGPPPPQSD